MKDSNVFIVAEAGVNHNGSLELAFKLIENAANAGANAVKFQTFKASNIVTSYAKRADYQMNNVFSSDNKQLSMLRKLELSESDHLLLIEHCRKNNIQFLSTPFDIDGVHFLDSLGMETFKIASGEITNLPLLRKIASLNKKVIMSTGMSKLEEVLESFNLLINEGLSKEKITVLHCTTQYPTPMEDVNLNAMQTIFQNLNCPVGYSDHTLGLEVAVAAVALGATVIEKHFTLSKEMEGPDHKASSDPFELSLMVKAIRNIESAKGSGKKEPSPSEISNIEKIRKSIVAKIPIKNGEIFSEKNLTTKRPGNGVSPMKWDSFVGKKSKKDYDKDEMIV